MGSEELFTIPIQPMEAHQGGSIVCTSPAPQVYLLTWNSPPDNRLTPAFCSALMSALNIIEFGYPPGVLITTSAVSKFYSNGLDLELAIATPGFFEDELYFLWRRFLTYPMPTIALINGHCFAAGLMLAMHHDYRVFTGPKGYMCLNEIEFGVPLMAPMSSIFRIKLAPQVYRQLVLEAHRFDGKEALSAGLVDAVGDLHTLLDFVRDKGLVKKGATGVYGLLKAEMYRESVALLESGGGASQLPVLQAAEKKRKIEGTKWFNMKTAGSETVSITGAASFSMQTSMVKHAVAITLGGAAAPYRFPRPACYCESVGMNRLNVLKPIKLGEYYGKVEIQPAGFTHLHNDTVPPVGSDTLGASGCADYEKLGPDFRKIIAVKLAVYHSTHPYLDRDDPEAGPKYVERVHPATGWKALWVNRAMTDPIVELHRGENDAILNYLFHVFEPNVDIQVRFCWTPGRSALWITGEIFSSLPSL
ncbi:hypothetical protein DL771_006843 [Monosporascus sp. 5C6A]|nr:hypothetical protein DL771_006843 [Monosporascus sp. 5C6A]